MSGWFFGPAFEEGGFSLSGSGAPGLGIFREQHFSNPGILNDPPFGQSPI